MDYPNYRVSVGAIIKRGDKVFICKRADNCAVAPGKWNIPAGKVKYEEVPTHAVIREAKEETQLDVQIVRELSSRAFKFELDGKDAFRLVFNYEVKMLDETKEPILDEEHSEGLWVGLDCLTNPKYASLDDQLRADIKKVLS